MATLATITVKLQAQIAEFQADFKEAAKSTEKFQQEFQGVATKASAYGNLIAIGAAAGASALTNLAHSVLENASNIKDLSQQTGLTMKTIQQFQSVADQTGTTLQSFTTAATTLGTKLAGGGQSVVNALTDLGLSFAEIQRLSPDEQFLRIADALGRMEDPQERNRIALQLFGRTFKELMPAMEEGYRSLAKAAKTSSDEQINALSDAENAWKRFKQDSVTTATSWAGEIILRVEEVGRVGDRLTFLDRLGVLIPGNAAAWNKYADALIRVRDAGNSIDLAKQIRDMQRLSLLTLKPAEGPTLLQFGTADMKAVEAELDAGLKRQKASFDGARTAVDAYKESVKRLRDELSGANLQAEVKKLEDAFRGLTEAQKDQPDIMNRTGEAAERLRQDGAKLSPELLTLAVRTEAFSVWLNKVPGQTERWASAFHDLRAALKPTLTALEDVDVAIRQIQLAPITGITGDLPGSKVDLSNFIPDFKPESLFGTEFGQQLGSVIGDAFRGGSVRSAVEDGASLVGSTLLDKLATKLTTGANAITGWLGGMISTALPLVGSLLGPLVGKIADAFNSLFGNRGRDLVKDFAASFGGFDSLHTRLLEMGSAGEALWIKLTQGVGRNNPAQAAAVIAEVTAALDAFGTEAERAATRLAGIGTAIEGVNAKVALFAAPFEALLKNTDIDGFTAKLAEMGQRGQAEFERLGTFVAETFAALVLETGDVFSAIERMGPAFSVLQKGVSEFGLTSTGTINALLETFNLINDKVFGPILSNIQATGQIFIGLQDGGRMTASLFQTVATDIGASFRELEAKGGDVAKAMALSQPVLQKLWEAQQIYGDITDDTTRSILKQAAEQDLVGEHMKDVNSKILAVLIEIRDIFGKDLPKAFSATAGAAQNTAASIQRDFSGIRIPPLKVPIEYEDPGFTPRGIPALAGGGIVRRRTLALVGEAGPEAVIPLNQLGSISPSGGGGTVIWEVDGRVLAEAIVPHYPGVIRQRVRPR